jgi:ribonuclease HI
MQHCCPCADLRQVGLLFCVDNKQVAEQINRSWAVSANSHYAPVVKRARWMLHSIRANTKLGFWNNWPLSILHRTREHNVEADALANLVLDVGDFSEFNCEDLRPGDRMLATSNGASRDNPGPSSIAGAVSVYREDCHPRVLARVCRRTADTTNVQAEFDSILLAMHVLCDWISLSSQGPGRNSYCEVEYSSP